MSWSMDYLRRLCRMFENSGEGEAVRVFFPDQKVQMTTYLVARMFLACFSGGEESGLASISPHNYLFFPLSFLAASLMNIGDTNG